MVKMAIVPQTPAYSSDPDDGSYSARLALFLLAVQEVHSFRRS